MLLQKGWGRFPWSKGVGRRGRWALVTLLCFILLSIVTIILFDRYFVPGLLIAGWLVYLKADCVMSVGMTREEVERVIGQKGYRCYQNDRWGYAAVGRLLSDKFRIVTDESGLRLEGSREVLKRVAKILSKA